MLPSSKMGNMLGNCDCDCEEVPLEQKLAKQQRNLREKGPNTVPGNGRNVENVRVGGRRSRRSKTKKAAKKNK